jgi:group I intron endonuclease
MIIYKAVNKINGKMYIGKTTRRLEVRLLEHAHEKRMPFSRAYQKYGPENFNILIIDCAETEKELNEKERKWIAYYKPKKPNGYNVTDGGDGTSGVKRDDTALRNKGLVGNKNPMYGKKFTDEEKKRFGQPGEKNARYGVKLSDELKKKISETVKVAMENPEIRKRISQSLTGKKHLTPRTEENCKKLSIATTKMWATKELREKRIENIKKAMKIWRNKRKESYIENSL